MGTLLGNMKGVAAGDSEGKIKRDMLEERRKNAL
jgi:hypothetical protein